jgi:molybdate transport system substrate-binding protein
MTSGSAGQRLRVGAVLFVLCALPYAPRAEAQDHLLVFAAASLKDALDDIDAQFIRDKKVEVTASFAASSALAKQIEAGAPADVFISADLDWMDYLDTRHLVPPGPRINLLGNKLVLIAPKSSKATLDIAPGFPLAEALGPQGRLAMADPAAVPAGKYGEASLKALGVWDSVSNRIAAAENARAALLLVSRAEAPLGIVYKTDAAADTGVRIVGAFPDNTHPPIIYPAAVLAQAPHAAAATDYIAYLKSKAAPLFVKYGFTMLE